MTDYTSLNDAAIHGDGYAEGETEIWYATPESGRDFGMGIDFLKKGHEGVLPVPTAISVQDSHKLVGKIAATDLEAIFGMMQGERWSPNGEARSLIPALGLHHTSMSIGDVVKLGTRTYFCDRMGFVELG